MKKRRLNILWIMAALFAFTGCNDFLDIQPVGKVMPKTAKEYRALLTDAYSRIPAERGKTTFRSDELTMEGETNTTNLDSYLDIWRWNDTSPDETTLPFEWLQFYYVSYIANSVI